jgi:hypothetical protein
LTGKDRIILTKFQEFNLQLDVKAAKKDEENRIIALNKARILAEKA